MPTVRDQGLSSDAEKSSALTGGGEDERAAPGSTFVMTFLLPLEFAGPDVRPGLEMAEKSARANGTPFISFFR